MFISDYQFEVVSDLEFMATIGWEGLMLKLLGERESKKAKKSNCSNGRRAGWMNTCMPLENHSTDVDATNQKKKSAPSAKQSYKFLIFYQKVGFPWSKKPF